MPVLRFADRAEAGVRLAVWLMETGDPKPAAVLGIPGGGVAVARAVADRLDVPLAALVARKIALPSQPEFAMGAVTAEGPAVWNTDVLPIGAHAWPWRTRLEEATRQEARRLADLYGPLPPLERADTALVVSTVARLAGQSWTT